MKDNLVYLRDILDSIGKIESFFADISFEDFQNDEKTQNAVEFKLANIGEAANRISEEFKKQNSRIVWRDIISMRNFLIHDYSRVDPEKIWETFRQDLPKLKTQIEKMIDENF